MSSKKYDKMISSLNNNIHQRPNEMLGCAFDLKSDPVDISLKDNAASTFVEPTTKEKLRYLRYFPLGNTSKFEVSMNMNKISNF